MIDMGMAENDCLDRADIKRKHAIALHRFAAPPLEKPAFEQNPPVV
jgi:hypothetical protein